MENNEYIYHFTSIENLLRIVISNKFMLNCLKNMNDITESKNFYKSDYIYKNDEFKKFLYENFKIKEICNQEKKYLDNKLKKLKIDLEKNNFEKKLFFEKIIQEFNNNVNCFNFKKNIIKICNESNSDNKKKLNEIIMTIEKKLCEIKENEEKININKLESKHNFKGYIDEFLSKTYIGCFSIDNDDESMKKNYPLWAHYGNECSGICIKFNRRELIKIFKNYQKFIEGNDSEERNSLRNISFSERINYGTKNEKENENLCICLIKNKINIKHFYNNYNNDNNYYKKKNYKNYCKKRRDIEKDFSNLKAYTKDKYLKKDIKWKYENEFRLGIYIEDSEVDRIFLEGINSAIEGILIGEKINDIDMEVLNNINLKIFSGRLEIK